MVPSENSTVRLSIMFLYLHLQLKRILIFNFKTPEHQKEQSNRKGGLMCIRDNQYVCICLEISQSQDRPLGIQEVRWTRSTVSLLSPRFLFTTSVLFFRSG